MSNGREDESAVSHARSQAGSLVQAIRSADPVSQVAAAMRFQEHHPLYSTLDTREIIRRASEVKQGHALQVIASEYGYDRFSELEASLQDVDVSEFRVRVYEPMGTDKIATYLVQAPDPYTAERFACIQAQSEIAPGLYEAECEIESPV